MLIEEARWIREAVAELGPTPDWIVLDVGSSSEVFRCVSQPHIDYYVYRPLRESGCQVVHVDAFNTEGIDLVVDVAGDEPLPGPDVLPRSNLVVCSNLLEHVTDRDRVLANLALLTRPGGALLLTVPNRYRYHPDPIDTMYRPSTDTLIRDVEPHGFVAERVEVIEADCGYNDQPDSLLRYIRWHVARSFEVRVRKRPLREPCRVTVGVFRRILAAGPAAGATRQG
ncbi:MAG: hypothetical protein QOJ67_3665 [Acidimicrobiaceae bacterium]